MLELAAYIDESGTHSVREAPNLCVAATMATLDRWRAFEAAWRPLVASLGNGYHAQAPECAFLAVPLAHLMRRYTALSCNVAVPREGYRRTVPNDVIGRFGAAYRYGAITCMLTCSQWVESQGGGTIHYYVEGGHRSFEHVANTLDEIARNEEARVLYRMATWAPASKKDLPMHCADTVAHHACALENGGPDHHFLAWLRGARNLREGLVSEEVLREGYVPRMGELVRRLKRGKEAARAAQRRKRR